ncbi:uncharacterized protein LY89DRAFT_665871 [Mollisia scopiformis]|uniref:DUF7726 domain-containing protein n=1 Tax=Mollisia scopiformis TaxID=149040 RepID=A0A194XNY4_MOLSC|nr:uncharacterized protein LY89DRAFT_665871 [Mollisia scopiformis]KUJ21442.1 hypothetical protein LY89DRAFT_665871 [Mollisia scopiformis]
MPKASRRSSGAASVSRAEPYPAIKPGDKPSTTSAAKSTKRTSSQKASTSSKASDSKVLTEKSPNKLNVPTLQTPPNNNSFLDVTLDTDAIYDTCSTVRQIINALLGKDNKNPKNLNPADVDKDGNPKPFTKASFCRAVGSRPDMLRRFMAAKKMMGGAESAIYPPAYKFFENKRVWEGAKKTKTREKVESDRPHGLPLREPQSYKNRRKIKPVRGSRLEDFLDEYGQ